MERPLILLPMRRTVNDARQFATAVHEGQTDKAGQPYVKHLSTVAAYAGAHAFRSPLSEVERDETRQIAWLHDAVEDERCKAFDLRDEGFPESVILAVRMLTNGAHGLLNASGTTPYLGWIELITLKADLPAILVKLADVEDNSDPDRIALLPTETQERLLKKYEPAKEVLRAAARKKGWQG